MADGITEGPESDASSEGGTMQDVTISSDDRPRWGGAWLPHRPGERPLLQDDRPDSDASSEGGTMQDDDL